MNHYLKEHPEIYVPESKELHYFGSDLAFSHDRSEEKYQEYFKAWGQEKMGGEASVWYLYSQLAASEIKAFNQEAKIIIMLRNPADMVHAHHSQTMYGGKEPITDFNEALDAEEGRRNGSIQSHPDRPPELLYYSEVARYTQQIQRYVDVFGREKVHVVIFDDLKSDVQSVYRDTLSFLEVDSNFNADLKPRNVNRKFRLKSLHYFVNDPPLGLKRNLQSLLPNSLLKLVKRQLQKANTISKPRATMALNTRKRLNEVYRDEVLQLSEYLERDLTHWLQIGKA